MQCVQRLHPDSEELERYALGRTPFGVMDGLEDHLLVCETCREQVRDAELFAETVRCAITSSESRARSGSKWGYYLGAFTPLRAAFAGAAVAVLAVFIGFAGHPSRPSGYSDLALSVTRSATDRPAPALAGTGLRLSLDIAGLPEMERYGVSMVDKLGKQVYATTASASGLTLPAQVDKALPPGTYWVRVNDAGGETLREYPLEIR